MVVKFSLLHATFRRTQTPVIVKEAWIGRAAHPGRVEYIFALDTDDLESLAWTEGHERVVSTPLPGCVTAVRNWNAAASAATGDLLIVIADDLFPPQDWDIGLDSIIANLDPRSVSFAVKLSDSPRAGDVLLRHPVVSRKYFDEFGLFSSKYEGVYCDNDITTRAFWKSTIIDGRSLILEHMHPMLVDTPSTSSHALVNADSQYSRGGETYRSSWPAWRRGALVRLVPPPTRGTFALSRVLARQRWNRCAAGCRYCAWLLLKRRGTRSPTPPAT